MNWKRIGVWTAVFYAVFWIGGNYSFHYTHRCVRSHQEEQVINQDGDTEMVTVCDWYSANAKRWTALDPVRSVFGGWSWLDAAVFGGIAALIGYAVWSSRREEREAEALRAYYSETYGSS
jgi:hypothetical protein